jgi:hypothetical protein
MIYIVLLQQKIKISICKATGRPMICELLSRMTFRWVLEMFHPIFYPKDTLEIQTVVGSRLNCPTPLWW